MLTTVLANYIVACSNLIAIPLAEYLKPGQRIIIYLPMFASYIYHLSETKHGLPGISPLNQYTNVLLNIDRFFAIKSVLYVMRTIYYKPRIIDKAFVLAGLLGTISLMYSERDVYTTMEVGNEFIVYHCIWHVCAYYILTRCVYINI